MKNIEKLQMNVHQAESDLINIKQRLEHYGASIPNATPSSEYASKINEVYESGVSYADDTLTETNDSLESVLYGTGEGSKSWYDKYMEALELHPEKTVSGSYISVDDVSEFPHEIKCTVSGVDNPESVTVTMTGANLLQNKKGNWSDQSVFRQVEWTVNADGTLNIFGTVAADNSDYYFFGTNGDNDDAFVAEVDLTLSTNAKTGSSRLSVVGARTDVGLIDIAKDTTSVNIPKGTKIYGIFARVHNQTVALQNIYFMLNVGTTALPYEPCNGQTLTPSADGTVEGMTSVYPYMNIFTDNADAMLDVTYRQSKGMQTESNRFWDSLQNNGKRTNYTYGFMGNSWNDVTFRPKYDINPDWAIVQMFTSCKITDLEKILNECGVSLNTRNNGNYTSAFSSSSFIILPHIIFGSGTSNASTVFGGCTSLHTIRKITIEAGASAQFTTTFQNCTALANVEFDGVISMSINFQWCPLTKESITSVINALSSSVTGQTATFKKTAKEAAFTDSEWNTLISTKSNWTFSLV